MSAARTALVVGGGVAGMSAALMLARAGVEYPAERKQALVAAPRPGADGPITVPLPAKLSLVAATGLLVVLGLFPSLLLQLIR